MRVPAFERYRRGIARFGLLVAGMVVGAAVYMSVHQHSYSIIHEKMENYKDEVKRLKKDLDRQDKVKNRQAYISSLDVQLEQVPDHPIDKKTENELLFSVRKDLEVLYGKPVARIKEDLPIYRTVVDKKVYVGVFDKDYQVKVTSLLVIQSELTVYITAGSVKRN